MQPQLRIIELPLPKPVSRAFQPPSLAAAHLHGIKIGLPDSQVDLWWNYYSANGWQVGRTKMVSWPHAMAGWKLRWQERVSRDQVRSEKPSMNVMVIQWQKSLERVESEMKSVKGMHWTDNDGWDSPAWKAKHVELASKRAELIRKLNGIV